VAPKSTSPFSDELLDQLLANYTKPEDLTGKDGILKQLTARLVERALQSEMSEHLGYEKHDPKGRGTPNSRNGTSAKTLKTELGEVDIEVPRDREGSFEPQLVRKRQSRFTGFDTKILGMYARGMTVRDIQGHLEDVYGVEVSPDLISKVTSAVVEDVAAWQNRPLDAVYPVMFLDAIVCKVRDAGTVRNKAAHLAVGVDAEGCKEVLGIWVERTEGAKFWLRVLNELRARGIEDVLIVVCDGLVGLPDAIEAVWPHATVQTCIVHLTRASLRWVNYKDRKHVARELRAIYAAPTETAAAEALDEFAAGDLGRRYPAIEKSWRAAWQQVIPFFAFPPEIRKVLYTTNMIESINYQLRKITKTRGSFPTDDALVKLLYLGCKDLGRTRRTKKNQGRSGYVWKTALNQLEIMYPDRLQLT